jgi:site-specific DNA recombinase
VRYFVDGREVRTIEVDPDRAPFIRKAFELYATGEYSLKRLHAQLTAEGLTSRPSAHRRSAPIALSKFGELLRNRYYLGLVTYRGIEHPGKHPALIGPGLFDRVQGVLEERESHAVKQRQNRHYLRGLLTCARCGNRLLYTTGKGRHGGIFDDFVCSARHKAASCNLPYLPVFEVEDRIERGWHRWVRLEQMDGEIVARELSKQVLKDTDHPQRLARAQRRIARLDAERLKLIQMAYADAIPMDLLKAEQQRIAIEREQAEDEAQQAQSKDENIMQVYEQARLLMHRGAEAYRISGPDSRRLLTRAFLARIDVDSEDEQATLASPWGEISEAAAHLRQLKPVRGGANDPTDAPSAASRRRSKNPEPLLEGRGSTINPLVELRGFEPLTLDGAVTGPYSWRS